MTNGGRMTTVSEAMEIARTWLANVDVRTAWIGGSTAWSDGGSRLAPGSDVDVYIVGDAILRGKRVVDGVVLDVTPIDAHIMADAPGIASHSQIGPSFVRGRMVVDRDGSATRLQADAASVFMAPAVVRARVEHTAARILDGVEHSLDAKTWPEKVMYWLFPTTATTHLWLNAAGWNPTVRKRYVDARRLLLELGRGDDYERLLALAGFDGITPTEASDALAWVTTLFDRTVPLAETSDRPFAGDLRAFSRSTAIDATRALIDDGLQREAMFWVVATATRCLAIQADANLADPFDDGAFRDLCALIGVRTREDIVRRNAVTRTYVERFTKMWVVESQNRER